MTDQAEEADRLHGDAYEDLQRKDYAAAVQKYRKVQEMYQQLGDKGGEAATWHGLARIDLRAGAYPSAREKLLKALAIVRDIDDAESEAATLFKLAAIDKNQGDPASATDNLKQALQIFQDLGDTATEATILQMLAVIALESRRPEESLRLLILSGACAHDSGNEQIEEVAEMFDLLASQLEYSQEQVVQLVKETFQTYESDRGWNIIDQVFPPD